MWMPGRRAERGGSVRCCRRMQLTRRAVFVLLPFVNTTADHAACIHLLAKPSRAAAAKLARFPAQGLDLLR